MSAKIEKRSVVGDSIAARATSASSTSTDVTEPPYSAPMSGFTSPRRTGVSSASSSRARIDRRPSVPGAGLHLFALGFMGAALLLERVGRLLDVHREGVDLLAAERLLDERPHDLDVLGVWRQGVGGDHPAALGRELPGDVELVVARLLGELEGD